MTMANVLLDMDEKLVAEALHAACEKLDGAGEVILDFSSVARIDAGALKAIGVLASVAGEKDVKIVLRGVNVDIYKVLKLAKLTSQFAFAN